MKEEITGAGPAFPSLPVRVTRNGEEIYVHAGMTLRDYFAAKALIGLLGHPDRIAQAMKAINAPEDRVAAHISVAAYHFADAMLEARK